MVRCSDIRRRTCDRGFEPLIMKSYREIKYQMFCLLPTHFSIGLICHKDHISIYLYITDLRSTLPYTHVYDGLLFNDVGGDD